MQCVPNYEGEDYEYFHITDHSCEKFSKWAEDQDWSYLYRAETTEEKVEILESTLARGMEASFEKKSRKKKSREPP